MWDALEEQIAAARGRLRADARASALRTFFVAATARSVAGLLVRGPTRPGRSFRTQLLVDLSRDVAVAYGALPRPEARVLHGRIAPKFPPDVRVTERSIAGVRAVEVEPTETRGGLVIHLHGGGFSLGSPETHSRLVTALARCTSTTVLSLDYRLAPEHPHPAAIDDLDAVLDAELAREGSLDRVVAVGDSAGGAIVLATLQRRARLGRPLPAAAVLISPNVDLRLVAESIDANEPHDYLSRSQLESLVRSYVGDADRTDPTISPIFASFTGLPPLLVHASNDEVLRDDAIALHARAEREGVACTLRLYDGVFHDFHTAQDSLAAARDAVVEIGAFLRQHLDAGIARAASGATRREAKGEVR